MEDWIKTRRRHYWVVCLYIFMVQPPISKIGSHLHIRDRPNIDVIVFSGLEPRSGSVDFKVINFNSFLHWQCFGPIRQNPWWNRFKVLKIANSVLGMWRLQGPKLRYNSFFEWIVASWNDNNLRKDVNVVSDYHYFLLLSNAHIQESLLSTIRALPNNRDVFLTNA